MFDVIPDDLILSKSRSLWCHVFILTIQCADITSSITYSPSASMAPEQTINDYDSMPWDTTLEPLQPMTLPNPTNKLELGVFFDTMDNGINRAMFNSMSTITFSGILLTNYTRCHLERSCCPKHYLGDHYGRRCVGAERVWPKYGRYGVRGNHANDRCKLGRWQTPFVSCIPSCIHSPAYRNISHLHGHKFAIVRLHSFFFSAFQLIPTCFRCTNLTMSPRTTRPSIPRSITTKPTQSGVTLCKSPLGAP
jgi:hypothetical protein